MVTGERAGANSARDAMVDFAEDLGSFLGSVQNKATSWIGQRKAITDQLTQIRDTANQYLEQLAGAGQSAVAAVARRGRPPGGGRSRSTQSSGSPAPDAAVKSGSSKSGSRSKRTMSPEARARIADAQRKRWAAYRAGNR